MPKILSAMKNKETVMTANMGMYLKPLFAEPFFIVAIMTAEKNDVISKDTIANILKSAYCIHVPENDSPKPAEDAALVAPPSEPPMPLTTFIKIPESAKRTGAAATVANDIKIT